jgi:hypothetical protein
MDDSWAELMIVMVRTLLLPAFKSAECFLDGNDYLFIWEKWKQNSNNTLPLYESVFVMMIPGRN